MPLILEAAQVREARMQVGLIARILPALSGARIACCGMNVNFLPSNLFVTMKYSFYNRGLAVWLLGVLIVAIVVPGGMASQPAVGYKILGPEDEYRALPMNGAALSPDGRRIAYRVGRGSRQMLIVDGRQTEMYSRISRVQFTGDSSRVAFVGSRGGSHHLVIIEDDVIRESPEWAHEPVIALNPAGKEVFANSALGPAKLIWEQAELSSTELRTVIPPVFSNDGRSAAFVFSRFPPGRSGSVGEDWHIVLNGVCGGAIPFSMGSGSSDGRPRGLRVFSLDGEPCVAAWVSSRAGSGRWLLQKRDGSQLLLEPNAVFPAGESNPAGRSAATDVTTSQHDSSFVVSGDGRHYAYVTKYISPYPKIQTEPRTLELKVFLDGKEVGRHIAPVPYGAPYHGAITHLTLSRDGSRLVYALSLKPNAVHIIDNGKKSDFEYPRCDNIALSPDGKRLAYAASMSDYERFVVIEGKEHGPYNQAFRIFRFTEDSRHLVAVGDGFAYVDGNRLNTVPRTRRFHFMPEGGFSFFSPEEPPHATHWICFNQGTEKVLELTPRQPLVELDGAKFPIVRTENAPASIPVIDASQVPRPDSVGRAETVKHYYIGGRVISIGSLNSGDRVVFIDDLPAVQYVSILPDTLERFVTLDEGRIGFFGIVDKKIAQIIIDPRKLAEHWNAVGKASAKMPAIEPLAGPAARPLTSEKATYAALKTNFPATNPIFATEQSAGAAASTAPRSNSTPSSPTAPTSVSNARSPQSIPVDRVGGVARELGQSAGKALSGIFRRRSASQEPSSATGQAVADAADELLRSAAGIAPDDEWRRGLSPRDATAIDALHGMVNLSAEQKTAIGNVLRGSPASNRPGRSPNDTVAAKIRELLNSSQQAIFDTANGAAHFR